MDDKKKESNKYSTKVSIRIDSRDLELFEIRYKSLEERGIMPEAKNRSQRIKNWLELWVPDKIVDYMIRKAIIYPESIGGNSNIRFSYLVERNQSSQTEQYHLI